MCFIDLEKAYDRILIDEVWRCLREDVPEKYVRIIKETYIDVTTRVKSTLGVADSLGVQAGLHQGTALSSFLFNIVFDVLIEAVRESPPMCSLRRQCDHLG